MHLEPAQPTAKGPARTFTGDVYISPLHRAVEPSRLMAMLVRFTPGARTHWHSHAVGQTLHCTDGAGLVVTRDGTVVRLRPGDTVWTPPGEEHWHGATGDGFMAHLALFECTADGDGATWLEPVSDEEYRTADQAPTDGR